jgi:uncharacterized protein YegP (UPF0339 family)
MPNPLIRFELFERKTLFGMRYYFRIVREGNNEILAPSQAYKTIGGRDAAINLIKQGAKEAPSVKGVRK